MMLVRHLFQYRSELPYFPLTTSKTVLTLCLPSHDSPIVNDGLNESCMHSSLTRYDLFFIVRWTNSPTIRDVFPMILVLLDAKSALQSRFIYMPSYVFHVFLRTACAEFRQYRAFSIVHSNIIDPQSIYALNLADDIFSSVTSNS